MVEKVKQEEKRKMRLVKPQCPSCDSMQVLFSKTTGKQWCRVCGHEWTPKETR